MSRPSLANKGRQAKVLFQRINRTDPEKIFIIAYNSYATAAITNGQAVAWDYAADADGVC